MPVRRRISVRSHAIHFAPGARRRQASFADVLLAGLAPDGGLYHAGSLAAVSAPPRSRPSRASATRMWPSQSCRALRASSFSDAELKEDIDAAYAGFDAPEIAPLVEIGEDRYLLELFHGPTLAFKDIALQILGRLFARALARRGGRATIVAATSGDTGSAAIAALGGLAQHRSLRAASQGPGQRRAAPPDDHQRPCQCPQHRAGRQLRRRPEHREGAVRRNGVRRARSASPPSTPSTSPASPPRASITSPPRRQLGKPATFVVPTGNFGDIFAGEAAERMGLAAEAPGDRHQRQRHHGAGPERRRLCSRARRMPP